MTEQVEAGIDRAVEALATLRGKEIRYADIRKGDRICVVTVDRWGGSVTDIDVVTHLSEDGWESESGLTLVGEGASDRRTFLLHRPAPSLPTEEGALKRAECVGDLIDLDPLGKRHPLGADLHGDWSGKVNENERILVTPQGDFDDPKQATTVLIRRIRADYHGRDGRKKNR